MSRPPAAHESPDPATEEFLRFADLFPEALLLVSADGLVLAANPGAERRLGRAPADLCGRRLADLAAEAPGLADYLRACSRSREMLPGFLRLAGPGGDALACRAEGKVFRPRSDGVPPLVLLRLTPRDSAVAQFLLLNQQVDALSREVAYRQRAEQEARRLHRELERRVAEFQTLLDVVPICIAVADDPACRRVWANPTLARLIALEPGANVSFSAAAEDRPATFRIMYDGREIPAGEMPMQVATATGQEVRNVELNLVRQDGSAVQLLSSAVPLRDEAGKVRGGVFAGVDITERKRHEALLEGQKRVLELMVCGAPLPEVLEALCQTIEGQAGEPLIATVLLLDEDGVYLRPVAGGRSPAGWTRAITPLRVGPCAGSCGTAAHRGEQVIVADIAADPLWADFRDLAVGHGLRACWSTPILSSQGRVLGTFAVYYDRPRWPGPGDLRLVDLLTRTAGIAVERWQAERALLDANRRKDEFLATLAHELRNPLAPLRNALQLLRLAGDSPMTLEQARGLMERQVVQMVRLIDDLLDVSRISRGKLELRKERVQLAAVVRGAVETARPLVEAAGHELTVVLPSEPVLLDADPTRLGQVIANLLNNAAKYTNRGGRIRLTAEPASPERPEAVVRVRDSGIGIPADQLPHIFEMFVQVDRSLERSQGGLGIGLTLVKRLVELHGGRVEAHSEGAGKGSEFVVRLPVVQAPAPVASGPCDGTPAAPVVRRKILVADDNRDAAETLGLMLRVLGHEVRTAHDGLKAVETAELFRPDVVLLDIGMPKLNGYDAARRIRAQEWGKTALLVALTGWGQEEDRRRTREAGFDEHLVKPADPTALAELLANRQAP